MKHFLLKTVLLLFALVVGSSAWGGEATFAPSNFSGQGTSGTGSAISATVNGVTFACDKGYGTTQIRCYGGSKITISSSNTITAISFTFSSSYTGGMEISYNNLSTNSWEKTLSSQARITAITVTYSTSAPAFDITAQSNNEDYGTVSLSGNVITATPKSGYRVVAGEGGYTVTNGEAEVTNNGNNTFSVNPTSNCTVQINFEAIPQYTVTLPATDAFGEYTMNKTNDVAYGTEVTLTYTPASGYENYVATWSVNGTPISGNKFNMPDAAVTVTVSLNEVFDMTLSNGDIVDAGDAADSYDSYEMTDTNGKTWNAYAIKKAHSGATNAYHYLQIKAYASKTAYYIQVPEYGRKITSIEMTVSSTSKAMDGGGNSATLYFSASNSTSATGTGVASGTGASKVTIDCSDLDLNTGYITAGGAVRIWDVKVTYDPIRLNSSGYATYAGLTPINYSDGSKFTAWAITEISGDAITFSKITGSVPAGTGVLLMGTAGQAVEPVVAASGTALATNLLVGTTTPTAVAAGEVYGLSGNTFVKSSVDGTIPAGKAYILAEDIPSSSSAKSLNFVFDDATGISTLERIVIDNDAWYDLQGRKVAQPTKGIYIHNGKKVFVK